MATPSSYARLITHHPHVVIGIILVVVTTCLVVSLVVRDLPTFDEPKAGFIVRGSDISNRIIAYQNLVRNSNNDISLVPHLQDQSASIMSFMKQRDSAAGAIKYRHDTNTTDPEESESEDDLFLRKSMRPQPLVNFCFDIPDKKFYTRVVYRSVDGGTILTAEKIRDICYFERNMTMFKNYTYLCGMKRGSCCSPWSLATVVAGYNDISSCDLIRDADVDRIRGLLHDCSNVYRDSLILNNCFANNCKNISDKCRRNNTVYLLRYFLLDSDYNSTSGHASYAATFFPLAGGSASIDFYDFIESHSRVYRSIELVGAKFNIKYILFDRFLLSDGRWLLLAGALVFLVIWFYTSSLFITIMTFLAMTWSLEMAYFAYMFVFEIKFFPYMNFVAIVIIVGLGTDDTVVFYRMWSLAKSEKDSGTLAKIVNDTLRHSNLAMLVTSFTTAVAFFSNYVSQITAIKCFSIFVTTAVLANYIFMITWLPAAIVIYEKWCNCCFSCYNLERKTRTSCKKIFYIPNHIYRFCSKLLKSFFGTILPFLIFRLYVLCFTLFLSIGIGSFVVIFYHPKFKLSDSKEFQVFPENHLLEQYDFKFSQKFDFERPTYNMPITVIFGIKPHDNGNYLDPYDKGNIELNKNFSLYIKPAQKWLLKFCRKLRKTSFYKSFPGLQLSNCFLENFRRYMKKPCVLNGRMKQKRCCRLSNFPYSEKIMKLCLSDYITQLMSMRLFYYSRKSPGPRFRDGQLIALIVEFTSNVPFSYSHNKMNTFYQKANRFISRQMSKAPSSINDGWFVSDLSFFDLQDNLLKGIPIAISVAVSVGGLMVFITTLNVLLSLYSIVTVALIVATTIAGLILLGWRLNIFESIIFAVSIGASFDYTLHYSVSYRLMPDLNRKLRVSSSLNRMSSPITITAITTFLSGVIMLPSTLVVYRRFGVFLLFNSVVSWLYSTLFFHAILLVIGPEGSFGQFHWPNFECWCSSRSSFGRTDKTVYALSESTVSSSVSTSGHSYINHSSFPSSSDVFEMDNVDCSNHLLPPSSHRRHHSTQASRLNNHKLNQNTRRHSSYTTQNSPLLSLHKPRSSVVTFQLVPFDQINSVCDTEICVTLDHNAESTISGSQNS